MRNTISYPFKVWMTSVLIAPLLMLSLSTQPDLVQYIFSSGFLQFYIIVVLIGGFVSIPAFLFLKLCYSWMRRLSLSPLIIRMLLVPICLLCCIVAFILFSLPDLSKIWHYNNVLLMGSYALPLVFAIVFYNTNALHEV